MADKRILDYTDEERKEMMAFIWRQKQMDLAAEEAGEDDVLPILPNEAEEMAKRVWPHLYKEDA